MKLYTIGNDERPERIDHVVADNTYDAMIIFQARYGRDFMKDKYICQGFKVSQEIIDVLKAR